MNKVRMSIVFIALLSTIVFSGCATSKVKSDDELIQQTLDAWGQTLVAKDLEKFMLTFSEKFTSDKAADKETLKDFIGQAIDAGYLDDAEVSFASAQKKMENGVCTVYPVDLSGAAGAVSAQLSLTKENGQWLITGMEVDGV